MTEQISPVEPSGGDGVVTTTYDLLTKRLADVAKRLKARATELNDARSQVFVSNPVKLGEQERLTSEALCFPRDAVSVGDLLLFGANVPAGLASRKAEDLLMLYRMTRRASPAGAVPNRGAEDRGDEAAPDWDFTRVEKNDPSWFLGDPSLVRDLGEMLTYYLDARLMSLEVRAEELLAVFAIGTSDDDVKVLRWSVRPGELPRYIDAYGEHDINRENRFDFVWTSVDRNRQVDGRWPHINLESMLFIGVDKGTVEFRIDDAVVGGLSLLSEAVSEPDQSLSELRMGYARIGDVMLVRLLPYRETLERFYVYNRLSRTLSRADAVGRGCHQLPEGHGVVFPGGFHLQSGETRIFATDSSGYFIHASHRSPNGEDVLYAYHRPSSGEYLLLSYNMVSRTMTSPIECVGYALFDDGTIVCVRAAKEPQRTHTVAVYSSPFCAIENYRPPVASNSFFGRVGNPELVLAIGECLALARDAESVAFNAPVFETLVARTTRLIDAYPWLNEPDAGGLSELLVDLRRSSGSVLDEFASVASGKREALVAFDAVAASVASLSASVDVDIRDVDTYIAALDRTRQQLADLATLRDKRYVEQQQVTELELRTAAVFESLSARALEFLGNSAALLPLTSSLAGAERDANLAQSSSSVTEQIVKVEALGGRLVMLTDVIGGLDVVDTTVTTLVLAALSEALAKRNTVRAGMDVRLAALRKTESEAAFSAGIAVLAQRTSSSLLASADSAACDAALAGLLAEVENLELRFGDVPAFSTVLFERRQEISDALLGRREVLASEKTHRVDRLVTSAERVLLTLETRAMKLPDRAAVDAFFASDGLALKIRRTIEELATLGENGRASELRVAVDTAKDRARRGATDRSELMSEGTVRIGKWNIGTNSEPFELRLVADEDDGRGFQLRLAGTELRISLPDDRLAEFADLANQVYPSETSAISRAVFLSFEALSAGFATGEEIRSLAAAHLDDGYELGVHDVDAERLTAALRPTLVDPGSWYDGVTRAVTGVWWRKQDSKFRDEIARSLRAVRALGEGSAWQALKAELGPTLKTFGETEGLGDHFDADDAVALLVETGGSFTLSKTAAERGDSLKRWARDNDVDVRAAEFGELTRWAFDMHPEEGIGRAAEAAWGAVDPLARVSEAPALVSVAGLRSTHSTIVDGMLSIDVSLVSSLVRRYRRDGLPRFRAFQIERRAEISRWRATLAIDRLRPRVLSSFVRNQLVDEVYLPLLGDNLSRQLGLNGPSQGLLLLISPPGYGKTTLIEYLVDLLGFALVKINGPALGSQVTSLDPGAAPDATSAEELRRLNRAFAMGTNVVCYLDDVQHVSPEFLQRFVPLCDSTRRIEGVLEGTPRTYDLSGRRFVMVMAGNPYTGAGASFRVPDMLANRADVYNLGDVVNGAAEAFAQSFIENACGANELLAPVIANGRKDLGPLVRAALGEQIRSEDLERSYSGPELQRIVSLLRNLAQVRDALMKVNSAYMKSATLENGLRGEPPFLMQGSYRNMGRIAPRVVPEMTPAEVDSLIQEHYLAESQTLAGAGAWNLAKLAEVLESNDAESLAHLEKLRAQWKESAAGNDPLVAIASALRGIQTAIAR